MADETEHTIRHKIVVEDHGSAATDKLAHGFHRASEGAERLRERLGEFRRESGLTAGALLGVGVGLGAWLEKTKEVNREFEHTNRMLSGLFATSLRWGKNVDFVDRYGAATKIAAEQTEELERVAMRFGGSLGEVGEQYHQLALNLGGLGLSRDKLNELTTHVRATAKAIGIDGSQLIEKIANAALFRQVQRRGEAGKFLAQALGTGNLRGMTQMQILERIDRAMARMTPAADKMSQGIGDSVNRIHLAVDSLLRSLTTPLFKEIGRSLSEWSEKLTQASDGARPLVEVYAAKLVDWFHDLKELTTELLAHWKEIAVIWAGFKVGGMLGGAGKFLGGKGEMGGALGSIAGNLGKFGQTLSVAVPALSAFAAGLQLAVDWLDKKQTQDLKVGAPTAGGGGTIAAAIDAIHKGQARVARGNLPGFLGGDGKLDVGALSMALKAGSLADTQAIAQRLSPKIFNTFQNEMAHGDAGRFLHVAEEFARQFNAINTPSLAMRTKPPEEVVFGPKVPDKFAKQQINFNVANLHVEQKFEEADPDRVFLRFKNDLEEQVVRPAVSPFSEPLGI